MDNDEVYVESEKCDTCKKSYKDCRCNEYGDEY